MEIQSENIKDLIIALVEAKKRFGTIPKDKINPFYKSKYAELCGIRKSVDSILCEVGLTVQHFHCKDVLITQLTHTSGQWQRGYFRLLNPKGDAQGEGAATTYASRYSLMSILGLSSDEDDDGNSIRADRPASEGQQKAIYAISKSRGIVLKKGIEDFTFNEASKFIEQFGEKRVEKTGEIK